MTMHKPEEKKHKRATGKDQTAQPGTVKVGYDVEPVKVGYDVEPVKVGYGAEAGKKK
jgi:hypothetical protein